MKHIPFTWDWVFDCKLKLKQVTKSETHSPLPSHPAEMRSGMPGPWHCHAMPGPGQRQPKISSGCHRLHYNSMLMNWTSELGTVWFHPKYPPCTTHCKLWLITCFRPGHQRRKKCIGRGFLSHVKSQLDSCSQKNKFCLECELVFANCILMASRQCQNAQCCPFYKFVGWK